MKYCERSVGGISIVVCNREVIGEGQLYFYYKRLAMEEILSGSEFNEEEWTESMDLQYYVWPLPKTETDQRVNVN